MIDEQILKLTITGFDSLENRDPLYVLEQKYFKSDGKLSAHGVCANYIYTINYKHHLGWDGNVYPKFTIERITMESCA